MPSFIWITDETVHDVNILDKLSPKAGSIYLFDRVYIDYKRRLEIHNANAFFITKAKSNLRFKRQYSNAIDNAAGLKSDQIGVLEGFYSAKNYPKKIRRIKYHDDLHDKNLIFLTNNLALPALTITQL